MANTVIQYSKGKLSKSTLKELYIRMLTPRMIEEKMLILLRQGKVSKWFSGIGQEAISVGCTMALEEDEMIFPMHRNLGVFTSRDIPLERLFCQWQGKALGFTKGRDRSFHFGAPDYNIVGMISHLGPQLSLATGISLAHKLKKEKKISLAFTGEGGTSEGEFHEALNVAAVWKLPTIFVVENNGYGLSTPVSEQFACESIADKGIGYGMNAISIDGNNILEVYNTINDIAQKIRKKPEPWLVECRTFRMRGHEEASGTKYVPKKLMASWAKKDPIQNFEQFLLAEKIIDSKFIEEHRAEIKKRIENGLALAADQPNIESDYYSEANDLFKSYTPKEKSPGKTKKEMRFIDAISDAHKLAMKKHDDLIIMGQDVAEYGGVFKITDGFVDAFGKERVRNTPICESAIIGAGIGLSLRNMKSIVEMQFSDFSTCAFNQIVNNVSKLHYRWGHAPNMVIRMPCGGTVGAGPFHSQTNEAWYAHSPGLKIVYPSNPVDAKGLLLAAIDDPNPVMYFEHKALYRQISEEVPSNYYTTPIGKAVVVSEGSDLTIVTYGLGVHWAQAAKENLDVDVEIIDLRTIAPIDYQTIETSIKKTNKVIVLHEDSMFGGFGGEISAHIAEHLFEHLDAPIKRVASMDTPVPFAKALENIYMPIDRLNEAIETLIQY